jgi:hypothetical protein
MNAALRKFIETFVREDKRERYFSLANNAKRRDDLLHGLLHDGRHLDRSKLIRIPAHRSDSVSNELKKLGVAGPGYAMAASGDLDDQKAEMDAFLDHYRGKAQDVVLYFPQFDAGYYENHEGEVYVFCKKS